MFLGHFAVGFAAKPLAPKTSLGSLFLAAQFVDLLWPIFLLVGWERVRIEAGATRVTPLDFESYPISHSLAAVVIWAALVAGMYGVTQKYRRGAFVLAGAVISHWLLDAIVHRPDLALFPGGVQRVGFGVWNSFVGTIAVEIGLFVAGIFIYARSTRAIDAIGRWGFGGLCGLLLFIYCGNVLGPPPPSVTALAWVGNAQWLLVALGYWVDRHRTVDVEAGDPK